MKIIIDSNVFITVINGEEHKDICKNILMQIENGLIEGILSTINLCEVLSGYYTTDDSINAKKFLQNIQSHYFIQDVTINVASIAAQTRAKYGLKLPDAIIYATMVCTESDYIVSQDLDFCKSSDSQVITPDDFWKKYQISLKNRINSDLREY